MDKNKLKQDFYDEVNREWLATATIPADRTSNGSFYEIHDKIEELSKQLFNEWATDDSKIPNDEKIQQFIKFYRMSMDWNKRNELGVEPIYKLINEIEQVNSFGSLFADYKKYNLLGLYTPIEYGVDRDFEDSTKQVLFVSHPELLLNIKTLYDDKERKQKLYDVFRSMSVKLLTKIGKTEEQANKLVDLALDWDQKLLPLTMSPEYSAEYTNLYNPTDVEKLNSYSKQVNFQDLAHQLVEKPVKNLVVTYPEFFEKIDTLISDENFASYKAMMLILALRKYSRYLDDETRKIGGELGRAISGIKEPESPERFALLTSLSPFQMIFGLYYAKTYFGPKAKADVERLVKNMIEIYKQRLNKNDWLSRATIDMAIKKLDYMTVSVGYPDEIESYYDSMITKTYEEGSNVLENILEFDKLRIEYSLSKFGEPVNNKLWSMSPSEVNAYFSPVENKIVFPAAILQKPFYSLDQSSSKNYGGIGAVIAHEISHGFDNNGAKFDEKGNMKNWWTEEDFKNFELKAQKMIEQFDGVMTEVGPCNGKLVVSENIADNGGVACAYEAAKLEKDFNAKDFMINFATIWKSIYLPETSKNLLLHDVHAPTKLRANIQIANMDDFYTEFDVTENDAMYIAPEKRVKIW
ncbi:M13 family metallopeptidase [[Mycoplasma] gypis]|uniref:M13 family metallopeptidase n=1 Tax=[Mycoplasma] gypis TaxID=92404 RepID=A0ABZ2RMV0_9BACT|nr:M13 family metallopeptidase [[Mycoplasma] gypis]MBN0919540.1 M13 family metallopeptidase [[Mycoplasma] gypis]